MSDAFINFITVDAVQGFEISAQGEDTIVIVEPRDP